MIKTFPGGQPGYLSAHELEMKFHHDTDVVSGDLITLDDERKLLVVAMAPNTVGGDITEYYGGAFVTNAQVDVYRSNHTKDTDTGEYTTVWDEVATEIDSIVVDAAGRSVKLMSDWVRLTGSIHYERKFGGVEEHDMVLFLQKSYGLRMLDRVIVSSEPYKVIELSVHQTPGLDVCLLVKDGRSDSD